MSAGAAAFPRRWSAMLAALTIAAGLASRRYAGALPGFVQLYVGDMLYAALIYWLIRGLWPVAASQRAALLAYGACLTIELSQLYHAPWLDAIRATRLGGLVLGFGFRWSDLLSYAVGILAALLLEIQVQRGRAAQPV